MAIKLITIDLDGTLLNDKKQVSERNRAAIMAAEDMGVMVTVSSGRCSPPAAINEFRRFNSSYRHFTFGTIIFKVNTPQPGNIEQRPARTGAGRHDYRGKVH